ncbi:helix-turn-helix domain-containing protein [Nonomuraea purpurea]|uniref:Helix-turn-helix domain-containing protein n=1 Tax=Nonomuraea purpurea TaxID=1849276 RepID=A0ABV8GNS9_9ACTN
MATAPNRFPADSYTVVPIAELTRVTSLADQLGRAAQQLASSLTAPAPTRDQTALPVPVAAVEPAPVKSRATQAEAVAYREHLYQQIHATGPHGASTADLATSAGQNQGRVHSAIRTLEQHGRVFRTGHGVVRWYATEHRKTVINAMRSRIPNHDLTVQEAADALGLAPSRIRELVDAKELDGRRVGNAIMIHRKGALAYIDTIGTTKPTQPAA